MTLSSPSSADFSAYARPVFDAAICSGALHRFADTVGALREIARTMKPGASLAAITFTAGNAGLFRFRSARERSRRAGLWLFEVAEMQEYLRAARFENYRPEGLGSLLSFSARRI
jgi:ubiquinone/menaquinone biosynthesis C-methylase UbiE